MNVNSRSVSKGVYVYLAVAMIVGCYLRLRHLDARGLWLDEAFSVATSDPVNSFMDVYRNTVSDVHPPFYQIVLWLFYHVFGFGEFTGRYLSAVFGILLIPSMFFLGRRLFDERVGVVAAWLVAINYFLISYSQETRSYALLVLLTVLSFLFCARCVGRGTLIDFFGYSLVSAMLVNTHYFGFLPVLAQVVFLMCRLVSGQVDGRKFSRFCIGGIFVALTIVLNVSYMKDSFGRSDFWIPPPDEKMLLESFFYFFGDDFLILLASAFFMAGFGFLMVNEKNRETFRLLVSWLAVGIVVPYVCSLYVRPVMTGRNLIIILPMILLVIAFSASLVRDRVTKVLMMLVFLCFSATPVFWDVSKIPDAPYRIFGEDRFHDVVAYCLGQAEAPMFSSDFIQFGVYFKLLGTRLKVEDYDKVEADLISPHRPTMLYFLDAGYGASLDDEFLKKYRLEIIEKKEFGRASVSTIRALPL